MEFPFEVVTELSMSGNLTWLDQGILIAYLCAVLLISFLIARRQHSGDDYFLANRSMASWKLTMSVIANQVSAVSLIGAPAFVALRAGGGMSWLQYELAIPIAMLLVIAFLVPLLRSVKGASIYEFAELRFGRETRRLLAAAFLISRGLALGVILYASAVVVSQTFSVSVDVALVTVGLFAVAYTTMGGITADIWTDIVQLVVLWVGTAAAVIYLAVYDGGAVLAAIPQDRTQVLVLHSDAGQDFTFWPMLIGGLFLYISYYGCDQSQAQRLLTARSDRAARITLTLNGLLRFPLVLTYCVLGLLLAGLIQYDAEFSRLVSAAPADSLVPLFIIGFLPAGLSGLFLAAIFAAAMSSVDSAMNSLAAVTLEDVAGIPPERQGVWLSRATSLCWGIFGIGSGLLFARTGRGVIELINQVGSAFYGPVLAVFVLAVVAPVVKGRHAIAGLAGGLAVNFSVGRLMPELSWLWWNPIGFAAACTIALASSRALPRFGSWAASPVETRILTGMFALILLLLAASPFASR